MARATRYTQDMMDEYFSKGLWTKDTTSDLWDLNAKLRPNKEAFVDSKKRLTWAQVKLFSDRIALGLLQLDLQRDEFIFVMLPNCVESYLMRCACEKTGVLCGTALMTLREKEIEHILKAFGAVGMAMPLKFRGFNIFDALAEMRPRLPALKHVFLTGEEIPAGAVSLERMMQEPVKRRYSKKDLEIRKFGPTEVAVIGFTSGTTGIPKGCEHPIAARMAMARAYGEVPEVTERDVTLNIISAVAGLSSAFCYNGSTGLVGSKVILSEIWGPERTLELIEREGVTILLSVPAQLAQIMRGFKPGDYDVRSLRCICTSTGPLPSTLAKDLEETFGIPVLNVYGQFDGGLISCVTINDRPEVRVRTVGKPHRDNVVRIVDDDFNEVPLGEVGEIVYTGPTTSSGYYRDLESTLRLWGELGRDGMCRSGDLGKFDKDGNLILVGRKKDLIIRGGQNIYPAEVEGLLLCHPKVKHAAIVPMPDRIMGEKCCAYVTLNLGERFTFEEMVGYLRGKKIAPYKLPERLEIVEKLPLRGEQKVAKGLLMADINQKLREEGKL
jgi:non-ribosomal peptide synthetase component E (peptide arylation enzyme)